ncbi:methyl-accepting chemotaxis protein [Actinoplanes sp. NPDC051859]|uniref:methyl-accepting chemotaxis protein n=1 Tax=Actinoplanes sp. NPDC051859 TaxID=3363909 RepID=UPI0037BD3FB8
MRTSKTAIEVTVRRNPLVGWLADRPVWLKNLLPTLMMALVAVAISTLCISAMTEANDDLAEMKSAHVDSMEQLVVVRDGIGENFRGLMLVWGTPINPEYGKMGRETIKAADVTVDQALDRYRTLAEGSDRVAAEERVVKALADYRALRNVVELGEEPPAGFTLPARDQLVPTYLAREKEVKDSLSALQALEKETAQEMSEHAEQEFHTARAWTIGALVAGLVLAALFALWLNKVMRGQLSSVSTTLAAFADGDLTRRAEVHGRDELGGMAAAVNRASDATRSTVEVLNTGARTLGGSARQLTTLTGRIGDAARAAAEQAGAVATDAGDVSSNVQAAASGAEEMGASISEIAQNANEAARVAAEAVAMADQTNRTVSSLGESSAEIGNVVKVITSIAEQTNLLALNATIEAARAGAAGSGFTVVANEVKDLAQETARATEDISQRVTAIQSETGKAVLAIQEIGQIIARINDYQLTIASAVDEQSATTSEMGRNVTGAADGTTNIARTIEGVAAAAQSTTSTLAEADEAVSDLAGLARELQATVGRFRVEN